MHQGFTKNHGQGKNTTLAKAKILIKEITHMAQKKSERKKELDRKRKRREERLKVRIKEAKAAKA